MRWNQSWLVCLVSCWITSKWTCAYFKQLGISVEITDGFQWNLRERCFLWIMLKCRVKIFPHNLRMHFKTKVRCLLVISNKLSYRLDFFFKQYLFKNTARQKHFKSLFAYKNILSSSEFCVTLKLCYYCKSA